MPPAEQLKPINSAPDFETQGAWSPAYRALKNAGPGVTVGPGTDDSKVLAQPFRVGEHQHFKLVARARSANGAPVKGQFQVNWTGAKGQFISAAQRTFPVTAEITTAECRISAPAGAVTGLIYVAPGGRNDAIEYFEMSLYLDFDSPPAVTVEAPARFPANMMHLSLPKIWSKFGNLFRRRFDPPPAIAVAAPPPCFPANMIHLGVPEIWSQFGNLFRGYDDEVIFKDMITKVVGNTMVTYDGLVGLLSMVRHCETANIRGDYVEIGSWRGGCSGLMALGSLHYGRGDRHIRVYDSFQGLPQPIASKDFDGLLEPMFDLDETNSQGKLEPINMLVAAESDVRGLLFDTIKYPERNVSIYKGWFQNTIPASKNSIDEIAILRLDGDLYDSYIVALEHLYPKVVKSGFVIIDDWVLGGCRTAVAEYFESQNVKPFLWTLDATTRCFQRT